MLIVLALTYYLGAALVDIALNRTRAFNRIFKVMAKFYESFPREKNPHRRYVLTIYDYDAKKFIDSVYLNEYGETSEEYQKYLDEMKIKHARKRVE
jgi:hypothetical protein